MEFHGVSRTALGLVAQVRTVAEHVGQGHLGVEDLIAFLARGDFMYMAPSAGQVAVHRAGVFLGTDHLDLHCRLQQPRPGHLERLAHRESAGRLERHFG